MERNSNFRERKIEVLNKLNSINWAEAVEEDVKVRVEELASAAGLATSDAEAAQTRASYLEKIYADLKRDFSGQELPPEKKDDILRFF